MALQQQDEDDLEENEPLIVLTGEHTAIHSNSSEEFIEARTVLQHDPWDVNAWLIFLEEAEVGKGGDISDVSAYQQFLLKFPRAARFWKRLAELQLSSGDFVSAGETLSSGAKQCWNVPLWDYYLDFLISNVSSYSSEKLQEAFEGSLEQIGFAHDSTGVWKKFLHHIQSGVDKGVCDINYLRSMYLKALNVPLENSDSIFADYEKFERTIQDPNFESYIAEGQKRFLHSKSILKERKKFVQEIVFERLSLPPSNTPNELSQLQLWNEWLRYCSIILFSILEFNCCC
jgi:cleavage stimulation factor subunit 3